MNVLKLFFFVGLMFCAVNISAQSVYMTNTGTKFHKNTCHYLKYSKKEISYEKALELRFTACSVCKPNVGSNTLGIMSTSIKSTSPQSTNKNTTSTQCTGKTKSGSRCKRMTKDRSGRCYQH